MAAKYPSNPPTSPQGRLMDDLLTCPVCLEAFDEPRTLSCLHSFCTKCLEGCRKPVRMQIDCPVCKKPTSLSHSGVKGLQMDYRIQQIKDLMSLSSSPPASSSSERQSTESVSPLLCDLCKSVQKRCDAVSHCMQCFMYFCETCLTKHNGNSLFASHQTINMQDSASAETFFCKQHRDQPIRYICKMCRVMLCTICTLDHDPLHAPEALEKGVIERYKNQLKNSITLVMSKLNEVKTKAKCLDTLRQSHQSSLFQVQNLIHERTEAIVGRLREQESKLLVEAAGRFEVRLRECGMQSMGEMTFYKTGLEALIVDMQKLINGSPQNCVIVFDELMTRMKKIMEVPLPATINTRVKKTIKFVPSASDLDLVIGSLQECSVGSDDGSETGNRMQTGAVSMETGSTSHVQARTSSILTALTPTKKDLKIGRVKAVGKRSAPWSGGDGSPLGKINADTLVGSTSADQTNDNVASTSLSTNLPVQPPSPPPASPTSTTIDIITPLTPRLVIKVDQVGALSGKLTSPSSVAFLNDGNIVIAECEHRLQVFDRAGHTVRVIGWGQIKPQSVVVSPDGKVAVTDKIAKTVKIYYPDGRLFHAWPDCMFGMPSGIAITSAGHYVVTDMDRLCVSIHLPNGVMTAKIGTFGDGLGQFSGPTHVVVDQNDNMFVSDPSNSCIRVIDKHGMVVRRFSLQSRNGCLAVARPQGIAIDRTGNILVCDRDNHKITQFTPDGMMMYDVLTDRNGLRYPCNIALSADGTSLAIVESHSGFLTNNAHHALKLFTFNKLPAY